VTATSGWAKAVTVQGLSLLTNSRVPPEVVDPGGFVIWLEPGLFSVPIARSPESVTWKVASEAMIAVKRSWRPTRLSVRRSSPASMLKRRLSAALASTTMPAPVLPTVPTPRPG